MLTVRNWTKWQNAILAKVKSTRKARIERGEAPASHLTAPLSIQSVAIATAFDEDFAAFAAEVGGAAAETYLIRLLQYVANAHAFDGSFSVPREKFGPIVLSRVWHTVGKTTGERVYDALIRAQILVFVAQPVAQHVDPHDAPPVDPPVAHSPAVTGPSPPCPAPPGLSTNGGGSSPPASTNGHALTAADAAVLKLLVAKGTCEPRNHTFPAEHRDTAAALKAAMRQGGTPDGALAFIDAVTPAFVKEVLDMRRTFAMAENGRKPHA